MNFNEASAEAWALRGEYPERPSASQWDDFFARLRLIDGPLLGLAELWVLERQRASPSDEQKLERMLSELREQDG